MKTTTTISSEFQVITEAAKVIFQMEAWDRTPLTAEQEILRICQENPFPGVSWIKRNLEFTAYRVMDVVRGWEHGQQTRHNN